MGTTGAGKTTIGQLLASHLGWRFADADDFHSPANIEKLAAGIPLTESDRAPWLGLLRERISEWIEADVDVVLACSALKRSHRELLRVSPGIVIVYLKGDFEEIERRLETRRGHFADKGLLTSQFETLEEPSEDEDVIQVPLSLEPQELVETISSRLALG
jgi:gluconokinase